MAEKQKSTKQIFTKISSIILSMFTIALLLTILKVLAVGKCGPKRVGRNLMEGIFVSLKTQVSQHRECILNNGP